MAASPIRDRLIPYKILAYLLYAEDTREWIDILGEGRVRLHTGQAARFFRLKNALLWEALYWLEKYKLVEKVEKETKRGTVLIILRGIER